MVAVVAIVSVLAYVSSNPTTNPSTTTSNVNGQTGIDHWWDSSSSSSSGSGSSSSSSSGSGVAQCLDGSGNPVDWWFTYKLPDGYQFAYIDANSDSSSGPMEIAGSLSGSSNALIQTLNNLISGGNNIPHMFYNDQPPSGDASSSYGHTKGVVAVSESKAFWIIHSTPHFPAPASGGSFDFPSTETDYGQTFLCMTTSASSANNIGNQLQYTRPFVYKNTLPSSVLSKYSSLQSVISKNWEESGGTNSETFYSGGVSFTSYAKNSEWDSDIYEDLVAPNLGSSLIAETWMRGEQLGSYCTPKYSYDVVDVTDMQVAGGTTWKETQDHAKWCITSSGSNEVCVCDINRMTSQRNRGGGCMCFASSSVYGQLQASIASHNSC